MKSFIASVLIFASSVSVRAQWVHLNLPNDTGIGVSSFASIGSNFFAGTIDGVFLSTDSGISWMAVDSGLTTMYVYSLDVVGTNLFAGTDSGVFRSIDSGKSWTGTNSGLPGTRIFALTASGTNLFCATNSISPGGVGDNVFLSTDNGTNWAVIGGGFPDTVYISAIAVSGTNIFVGGDRGIFLSTDNGTNWTALGFSEVLSLALIGTNLIVGAADGIGVLDENGYRWISSGLTSADVYAIGSSGANLFAGTYNGGVFLSTDNGISWTAEGLTDTWANTLVVNGTNLFAGTNTGGWRRPLSDFAQSGVVGLALPLEQSINVYPNPCSESAAITFSCAASGTVEVTIVNLLGTEVARIFEGELDAGEHSFTWDASCIQSGMYVCHVRSNGEEGHLPVMLLR
jgi:hypothetical protein